MFLDNYYKMLGHGLTNPGVSTVPVKTTSGATKTLKSSDWARLELCDSSQSQYQTVMKKVCTSYFDTYPGVLFGNGDTPVSFNDYCLSGSIVPVTNVSCVPSPATSESYAENTYIYTITNTSSAEMVIKEVGLLAAMVTNESNYQYGLIERTVLDNPVTIPAGSVGMVKYTLRFNFPTA